MPLEDGDKPAALPALSAAARLVRGISPAVLSEQEILDGIERSKWLIKQFEALAAKLEYGLAHLPFDAAGLELYVELSEGIKEQIRMRQADLAAIDEIVALRRWLFGS